MSLVMTFLKEVFLDNCCGIHYPNGNGYIFKFLIVFIYIYSILLVTVSRIWKLFLYHLTYVCIGHQCFPPFLLSFFHSNLEFSFYFLHSYVPPPHLAMTITNWFKNECVCSNQNVLLMFPPPSQFCSLGYQCSDLARTPFFVLYL